MKDLNIQTNYLFNENYMLRNDQKRYILTNRSSHNIFLDRNTEDFPEAVNTKLHPLLALLYSLFDGNRSKHDITVAYSDILGVNAEVVAQFVDNLFIEVLAKKEKKFIKFEDEYYYIPHNLFLENKNGKRAYANYNYEDFFIPKENLDIHSFRHYYPLDCMFEVNFTCYTDCIYCYADRRNRDRCTIPFERVKELIKEAKALGMRTFDPCGGELFLYEHWESLLKELHSSGFRPYISTKIPITKIQIKKLKNLGQKDIQLSLDSIISQELEKILKVGGDYFEKMEGTLKLLEEEGFNVYINGQVTSINNNSKHVELMLDYLLRFQNVRRIKMGPVGRSLYLGKNAYGEISADIGSIEKIEEVINSYSKKYPDVDISFSGYATKDKYVLDDLDAKANNYNERAKCSGNFYGFIILPDGRVTICEELYFHPTFIIGDLRTQSIMEVWNSERALELYKLPQEKIRDESACKKCPPEEYEKCRQRKGVCWKEILAAYNFDNWDYPDPKCPHAPAPFNKFWLE